MLIKIQDLARKYNLRIHGILHIGAHECEELGDYMSIGVPKQSILWVEGNPHLVEKCKQLDSEILIYEAIVSNNDGENVILNITNNSQSSSILPLKEHARDYPHIVYIGSCSGKTKTIKSIYKDLNLDKDFANFLNIDIQGAELLALQGMGNILDNFDYLYLEVNIKEMYGNCPLLSTMDEFLWNKGFYRAEMDVSPGGWGDAFYIKRSRK